MGPKHSCSSAFTSEFMAKVVKYTQVCQGQSNRRCGADLLRTPGELAKRQLQRSGSVFMLIGMMHMDVCTSCSAQTVLCMHS